MLYYSFVCRIDSDFQQHKRKWLTLDLNLYVLFEQQCSKRWTLFKIFYWLFPSDFSLTIHLPILTTCVQRRVFFKKQEWLAIRELPGHFRWHGHCCSSMQFSFLFCFVCLRPVSCVLDVADVSGLFILSCPFGCL